MVISGLLYGLLSAFAFGTADFLAGLSSRRIGSYTTLIYMQAVGLAVLSIYLFSSDEWHSIMNHGYMVMLAMIFMGIDLLGILCLYQGLAIGKVSIVAPIASSFAAITVILAIIFGETPSIITLIGIILTIIGVIIASLKLTEEPSSKSSRKGIMWAILASILLGVAFFGLKFPTSQMGAFSTVWIGRAQSIIALPLILRVFKQKPKRPQLADIGWISLVGIFDVIALISYNLGITTANTSVVVTITSLFAIVTMIWGIIVWKERIIWNQILGISTILIGILLINL
ncbi:Uncharacterized membrane protein [Seinonella peptonophila]|uniref:Uncharacterized membrane protein n=1 Tax=Seinonella peptonophila TaxID=112248 RepID=A0A1M4ZP37_9BACL|nr:EamA family transporter [Seinonella peptonophila]SHF19768.1 Uncharacterized membrane protein [Seinonella peptonophila]